MATFFTGFICLVIGAVGGFVVGALFFRNNAKKITAIIAVLADPILTTEQKMLKIKEILGV